MLNDIDKETLVDLFISRITFLSFEEKKILKKNIDSSYDLALLSIVDICKIINRDVKPKQWDSQENLRMAKISQMACESLGIKILSYSHPDYPQKLLQIYNPPFVLFARGNVSILNNKSVSVVGTRRLSIEGKEAAHQFTFQAAMDGCNVISGLAVGADGFAHRGAIDAFYDAMEKSSFVENLGKTIAVLPSSIDEIVPAGHKKLASQILQTGGCILSEYEPKMNMATWHFVARNRIIAGMSDSTVVIQAPTGSGALITADFALESGRDVMFHKVSLCENAKSFNKTVELQLDKDLSQKKISKYKRENTLEKYLEAGAPVIENYIDFCKCLAENPGTRKIQMDKQNQLSLFES